MPIIPNDFQNIYNKDPVPWRTSSATGVFSIAQYPCEVMAVATCWEVASGTSGIIQLEKLTGTTAPGSGDAILSATMNTGSTANTVYYGSFAVGTMRQLDRGHRLGFRYVSGTVNPTGFNGMVLVKPLGKGHYQIHGQSLI